MWALARQRGWCRGRTTAYGAASSASCTLMPKSNLKLKPGGAAGQAKGPMSEEDNSKWGCLKRIVNPYFHPNPKSKPGVGAGQAKGPVSEDDNSMWGCLKRIVDPDTGKRLSRAMLGPEMSGIFLGALDTTGQTCAITLCAFTGFYGVQVAFGPRDGWHLSGRAGHHRPDLRYCAVRLYRFFGVRVGFWPPRCLASFLAPWTPPGRLASSCCAPSQSFES